MFPQDQKITTAKGTMVQEETVGQLHPELAAEPGISIHMMLAVSMTDRGGRCHRT